MQGVYHLLQSYNLFCTSIYLLGEYVPGLCGSFQLYLLCVEWSCATSRSTSHVYNERAVLSLNPVSVHCVRRPVFSSAKVRSNPTLSSLLPLWASLCSSLHAPGHHRLCGGYPALSLPPHLLTPTSQ